MLTAVLWAQAPRVASSGQPDREALLALHQELLESTFLRRDASVLAAAALPNLLVVPPGGVVERREQVLSGVRNLAAESLQVDDIAVADHGTTSDVVARVWAMRTAGQPDGKAAAV